MKTFWESKTIIFNVLSILLIIITEVINANVIPAKYLFYFTIAVNVINIILRRYFTSEPIVKK